MKYEAGVEAALAQVHAKGLGDGIEHAIILRDGQRIWTGDGDKSHVDVTSAPIKPGDVGVHNHPGLNSLSNGDIAHMFYAKLDAIYAISQDGSIYKARPRADWEPRMYMDAFEQVWGEFGSTGRLANELVKQAGKINSAHWVNRLMASAGVIHYEYELGDETAKLVEEYDAKTGFARLNAEYANMEPDELLPTSIVDVFRGMFPGLVVVGFGSDERDES